MSKQYAYNPDYAPKCEHNQDGVTRCVSAEIFMACIKERDELYVKMEKKYKKKIEKLKDKIIWLENEQGLDHVYGKKIMSPQELKDYAVSNGLTLDVRTTDLRTGKTTTAVREQKT